MFHEQLRQAFFYRAALRGPADPAARGRADRWLLEPADSRRPADAPVLQALEQRLQALATNATNEIPAVAGDTAEPALSGCVTPSAATPTARP